MPTTPIRIDESPQGRFGVIKGGKRARYEFCSFLLQINNHLPRGIDQAMEELAFLLPYFEACSEGKFLLRGADDIDPEEVKRRLQLALGKGDLVHRVIIAPMEDCESRPSWATKQAMKHDFFRLLFLSSNQTFTFPTCMALSRGTLWENPGQLRNLIDRTLGSELESCVRATFKKPGQDNVWSNYTKKLLCDIPYALLRECIVEYCMGDTNRFEALIPLVEISHEIFVLGRQQYDSYSWLVLTGPKQT